MLDGLNLGCGCILLNRRQPDSSSPNSHFTFPRRFPRVNVYTRSERFNSPITVLVLATSQLNISISSLEMSSSWLSFSWSYSMSASRVVLRPGGLITWVVLDQGSVRYLQLSSLYPQSVGAKQGLVSDSQTWELNLSRSTELTSSRASQDTVRSI